MFKPGDVVICIRDSDTLYLKIDKTYIVNSVVNSTFSNDHHLLILNGIDYRFSEHRFKLDIKSNRKQKIQKLNEKI